MGNGKEKKKKSRPSENPKGGILGGIYNLLPESLKNYTGGGSMRKGGGVDETASMRRKKKRMMA